MSKKFLSVIGMIISRGIYVVLGMFIAMKLFTVPANDFIGPDFGEMAECVDYQASDETLLGQVCHFDNEFMYIYLPDALYFDHVVSICSAFSNEKEEETNEDYMRSF